MHISIGGEEIRVHYEVSGQGPDVLFVHGLGLSSMKTWTYQLPEFSKYFRVHAYDVRGFGTSDNPSGRFSVQQCAYDLYALLVKQRIERVILIGFSMGGWIAQQFILDHPEMVRSIVLSNTTSGLNLQGIRRFLKRSAEVEQLGSLESIADEQIGNTFSEDTRKNRPELVSFYKENFLNSSQNHYKAYAAMFRALTIPSFTEHLDRITCPALILCGDSDQGITRGKTPTDAAEILHKGIKDSELFVFKNAGHYAHLERAQEWNKVVIEFIDRVLKP